MKVTQVIQYPVKSMGGVPTASASVHPRGLEDDRRWVVCDSNGATITGREVATMPLISARRESTGLVLTYAGHTPMDISTPTPEANRKDVVVWGTTVNAADAGDPAASWLTRILGKPCRLLFMDENAIRKISPDEDQEVSFADEYPLLLTNEASLSLLSERAGEALDMRRFRPNVVISGASAFEEDTWRRVKIGDAEFEVSGPCERCSFTVIDPDSGDAHVRQEPLRTLATFRRNNSGEVCFGQNLIPLNGAAIRQGDSVRVLETGTARPDLGKSA